MNAHSFKLRVISFLFFFIINNLNSPPKSVKELTLLTLFAVEFKVILLASLPRKNQELRPHFLKSPYNFTKDI